jgi:1-acyl-sn-glycerol-3-phosphate acyltransferase
MAIAPEGTRSKDGRLQPGKPGVVALAVRCQTPLFPVAFYGYENFWANFKRLRRSDFHLAVGKPFYLKLEGELPTREVRQAITDEIMYKIAELLPEKYRGCYQFNSQVQYRYLQPAI